MAQYSKENNTTMQNQKASQLRNNAHRVLQTLKNIFYSIISSYLLHNILYFIMCNVLHHVTSKLYLYLCTTDHHATLSTLAMSPIIIISPHCIAIRWTMMESTNIIYYQILSLGSWLVAYLS
jgi:hypothetical protein